MFKNVKSNSTGGISIQGLLDKENPKAPRSKRSWAGLQVIRREVTP